MNVPPEGGAVLELLPVGVAWFREGRLVYVNPALCQLVRLEPRELMSIDPFTLLAPEDEQRVRDRFKARQRGEEPTATYEIRVRRGDGSWVALELEPRLTGPGEAVLLYRDLSPFRREQKLLGDLGALAARVQQASTLDGVRKAALDGLFALGLQVSLATVVPGGYALENRTAPELDALIGPLRVTRLEHGRNPPLDGCVDSNVAVYIDDAVESMRSSLERLGVRVDAELARRIRNEGFDRLVYTPLRVHGRPYGALIAAGPGMSRQAAAALSLFGAQLASALEVAETIEELQKQNRRLAAINALAVAGTEDDPAELDDRLLRIVSEATGSDAACVYRAVPEEQALVLEAVINTPQWYSDLYRRLPLAGSVTGGTAESRRPRALVLDDWPAQHRENVRRVGHLASAVLPLVAKGRLSGTLNLSRFRAEPYTAEDLSSAELLAAQVAMQLERSRLVSELRRSYDQLARAQKELVKNERLAALGELAAVIAHEVRNPLAVVFNSIASLRKTNPAPETRRLLGIVSEESERLDRLVSDLLDFARPHSPRLQPEVLADVVGSAVEAAVRGTAVEGISIEVEVPRELPRVLVDAPLCRQAILNLVLNGAQATPKGGEVTVRGTYDQASPKVVRLDVSDRGAGIAPELVDRIYQPFFTTRASGTGLGLALVKRIAEVHGAELAFESKQGHGTTFSLWLPVA